MIIFVDDPIFNSRASAYAIVQPNICEGYSGLMRHDAWVKFKKLRPEIRRLTTLPLAKTPPFLSPVPAATIFTSTNNRHVEVASTPSYSADSPYTICSIVYSLHWRCLSDLVLFLMYWPPLLRQI